MSWINERWSEILDGKRDWYLGTDAQMDSDRFFTEFVIPLRRLLEAGKFQELAEVKRTNLRTGRKEVSILHLVGGVGLGALDGYWLSLNATKK